MVGPHLQKCECRYQLPIQHSYGIYHRPHENHAFLSVHGRVHGEQAPTAGAVVFDRLSEIPLIDEPTFTLAHIICPHPPYIFAPDGGKLSTVRRVLAKADPRDLYRDQVLFVNSKLRTAVEQILSLSKTPPIIIIQGDHGAAYTRSSIPYTHIFPDDAYLKEQMCILNAYYFPGVESSGIYDSITPVNSFRIMLNKYFNAGMPMLEDSSFYSSQAFPFDFINVTEKVHIRK